MPKKILYKVVRRRVKYPRLEIKTGDLVVIAPSHSKFNVEEFVGRHTPWIEKKIDFIKGVKFKFKGLKLKSKTDKDLRDMVKNKVMEFESDLKVSPKKIRFMEMKTKWGSCSSGKNLSFNTLLRFLPNDLIEYVVYHEMCHLRNLKHDNNFWNMIEKRYPKHKKYEEKLFGYWFLVSKKLE